MLLRKSWSDTLCATWKKKILSSQWMACLTRRHKQSSPNLCSRKDKEIFLKTKLRSWVTNEVFFVMSWGALHLREYHVMICARYFKNPRNQRLPSLLRISASFSLEKILGPTQYKYVRAQMWGKLIVSLVYMTGEVWPIFGWSELWVQWRRCIRGKECFPTLSCRWNQPLYQTTYIVSLVGGSGNFTGSLRMPFLVPGNDSDYASTPP